MVSKSRIFKDYDIRGIYNKNLTEKDAYLIGYYFSKLNNVKRVLISHDSRISSESLSKFLIAGFRENDIEVIYAGMNSTVNFYYAINKEFGSGIQITASHNPKEYNGFKLILNKKSYDVLNGIYDLEEAVKTDIDNLSERFKEIFQDINNINLSNYLKEFNIEVKNIQKDYLDFLYDFALQKLSKEDILKINNYDIAIDFGNSVSQLIIKDLVKQLGLKFKFYNDFIDGEFKEHNPNPFEMESYFKNVLINAHHDLIIGFDGDGDRIGLLDQNKNYILMDYIIALFIDNFIKIGKKSFVVDLRVSKGVKNLCKESGAVLELSKVGRNYYIEKMKLFGSFFGAETSGHMFFKEFYYFDNPDIALIYLIKFLSLKLKELENNDQIPLYEIFAKYNKYYKLKEINFKVKNKDEVFELLRNKYKEYLILELDGLSFDLGEVWFNVRASNTEEVIRLNIEGENKEVVEKTKSDLSDLIK